MPSLGSRIVALRKARGWTQPELARRIGISQPSMHNIETGKTKKVRGDTLAGLCTALGVSPDVLLHGAPKAAGGEAMLMEAELVTLWRGLTQADQEHVLATARAFSSRMTPAAKPKAAETPQITPAKQT